MVINDGKPQSRSYPNLPISLIEDERIWILAKGPSSLSEDDLVSLFTSCVLEFRLPNFCNKHTSSDSKRLKANVYGCCDTRLDITFLKLNIDSLLRLDLEQAAAAVISAIRNDDAIANRSEIVRSLLKEIDPKVLTQSCMWFGTRTRTQQKSSRRASSLTYREKYAR